MAKITARLARVDHPNGQTVRGGVVWTREWQTADLNKEDAAAVKADKNLETRRKHADAVEVEETPSAPDAAHASGAEGPTTDSSDTGKEPEGSSPAADAPKDAK